MKTTFNKTLVASLIAFASSQVYSAAFQLAEISTSGLGMAYAGNAAVADNASVVASNPALMNQFKSAEISAGGVLIATNLTLEGKTKAQNPVKAENIVPTSFLPNIYFVSPINDQFSIGTGYNINYGLKTEYDNNFAAGTMGGKTSLAAHNFNVSGAYNLGNGFSFGAGINAIYSDAEIRRTLGDTIDGLRKSSLVYAARAQGVQATNPTLASNLQAASQAYAQKAALMTAALPKGSETEILRITGNEWSFGWNAGLTYEINPNHRFGLAYHSAVDVKFVGHYQNELPFDLTNEQGQIAVYKAAGQRKDGKLTLNLPAYWELSGFHKLTDQFAVQYSWKRTEWSRLKNLDAYDTHNSSIHYLHKAENFRDSNRYALGVSFDATPDLTLRAGVAYDRSASVDTPSISIPDTNRVWYSAGLTYKVTKNLSTDVGYAYLRGTSFSFKEDGAAFKTRARGNLYGLNLNYKF